MTDDFIARAQRTQQLIKEILMNDWDPIGVARFPDAQDEYDAYVAEVYKLLARRASTQDIFDYLWWLETEHMGLSADRQRTLSVAQNLANLLDSNTAHPDRN